MNGLADTTMKVFMKKKFKLISEDLQKNLIEFLDEVQFDAASDGKDAESMHKINFCTWAINELLESFDAYVKGSGKKSEVVSQSSGGLYWNFAEKRRILM